MRLSVIFWSGIALLCLGCQALRTQEGDEAGAAAIVFLDVGQGDAVVIGVRRAGGLVGCRAVEW